MLGIEAVKFLAYFLIIAALVRVVTAYILERNPDSSLGKSLAFIH